MGRHLEGRAARRRNRQRVRVGARAAVLGRQAYQTVVLNDDDAMSMCSRAAPGCARDEVLVKGNLVRTAAPHGVRGVAGRH